MGGGAVYWWIEADETGKIPGLEPSKAIRCSPASMVQSVTVFRQEISSFLYSCSVHRRTVVGGRVGVAWSSDRMSNWVRVVLYLFRWWRSRSVHCTVLLFSVSTGGVCTAYELSESPARRPRVMLWQCLIRAQRFCQLLDRLWARGEPRCMESVY